MITDITIEQIVHPDILTCTSDTLLSEAAQRMTDARCSSILVLKEGTAVGIWTERDALALDMSAAQTFRSPIAQHMASPVKTIHVKTGLGEVAMRFRQEKVRHFLVVDDAGEHRGIITQTDIVANQGIEYYLSLRKVESVLDAGYPVIGSDTPLNTAIQAMHAGHFDALLVSYPDGSHGILTERDVMRLISSGTPPAQAGELASRPLVCIALDTSLYHARKLFSEKRIRHLGVADSSGQLLGLVTFASLLESIEHDYVRQLREALKDLERSLALSQQNHRLATKVFESTFEGIMVTSARNLIESVNPAFTQITGFMAHEVIGKTPAVLSSGRHDAAFYQKMHEELSATGHWQGEIWNRRKNGEIYPEWLTINTVKNEGGQIANYVGVFSDITKRKVAEEHMLFLAHHDGLTSLPNRALFIDRLGHAIAHAHRNQGKVAVMYLDLDRFKEVNDTLGHHIGDQLLQVVAQRLTACVREDDTVARLGGDEFTVILESIGQANDIVPVAKKIIDSLSQPMQLDDSTLTVTVSVGISLYPVDSDQADDLVKYADTAMYLVKKSGRNNFQFFASSMKDQLRPGRNTDV